MEDVRCPEFFGTLNLESFSIGPGQAEKRIKAKVKAEVIPDQDQPELFNGSDKKVTIALQENTTQKAPYKKT